MTNKVMIHFPNQDIKIPVEKGISIALACSKAKLPLDLVCGGKGICKKCITEIEEDGKKKTVLACEHKVDSDVVVFLREYQIKKTVNILTDSFLNKTNLNSSLKKIFIKYEALPLCSSTWEHITKKAQFNLQPPSLSLLQKLSSEFEKTSAGKTLVLWRDKLIALEEENTTDHAYGVAIDIGTTTVAAYFYDLVTGKRLGIYSALNGQVVAGGDVITRIVECTNNPQGLETLQSYIVDTINQLIDEAVREHKINRQYIYTIVLCGNSAMQHLFLGLNPKNLGKVPFTNIIKSEVIAKANQLNLNISPQGIINFLPLIGGFVGADTTAVLLSLEDHDTDKIRLIIDLGTNGELVLGNKNKLLATSTAAGPALEGAEIQCGMRGTNGAIEKVTLSNGHIQFKVIMNEKPLGICGSGLIDSIAEMLKVGIINDRGKLLSRDEFLANCRPEHRALAAYLERLDDTNIFILADKSQSQSGKKIYISQKDIRAVQLAKGAIYTGCMLLLEEYGIKGENLDEILIAGAFGNYIDIEKGQYIGLLPSFEGVPIKSIGNAAGAGVQRFLLSQDIQDRTVDLIKNIQHIELASNPSFHMEYFKNINFPKC